MKTTLLLAILALATSAQAKDFKPSDDLSAFVSASGTYSRSLVTDDEDKNGFLCSDHYRMDVKVDAAAKEVAITTYIDGSMTSGGTKQQYNETIPVGTSSASTVHYINAIDGLSVSGVANNAIVKWARQDVPWMHIKGKWKVDKTLVEFISPTKIKIGDCTFRR